MADPYIVLSDATAMLDEVYDTDPIVQQARFGATAQHISRSDSWKGGAMHKKFINQIFSRTLANSDLESDAPDAGKISTMDIKIEEANLRKLHFSLRYSIPAGMEVDGSDHAVWQLAKELVLQAQESLGEKRNQLIHQNADCVKALVAAVYNEDGTTYTAGQTDAFIQIDNGSISAFHEGEILDIREASDNTDVQVTVTVNDVWHDPYYRDLNIGPGIVVTIDSDNNEGDANLDNIADNDEIVAHGEAAYGYPVGFETLCLRTSPGAYFSVTDRAAVGYQFLIPYGRDWGTVDLDVDTHFGIMADVMGMVFGPARASRRAKGFRLTDAIVAICQPDLLNEAARQVGNASLQFTKEAVRNNAAAKMTNLTAVMGWEGVCLHHPSLPPIVLQSDPLATKNKIRFFEPSAFEWIRMGNRKPTFIKQPGSGSIWHNRRNVTTGNLTVHLDSSAFVIETLFCEQPKLVYSMDGVTSSL